MFPHTVTFKKITIKLVDMFPQTDASNDINSVLSSHVETVALITRKNVEDYRVEIKVDINI